MRAWVMVLTPCLLFLGMAVCSGHCQPRQADYWPTEGWKTAAPGEQGVSAERLEQIDPYVRQRMPRTTSLVVIRGGFVVFEKYWEGDEETLRVTLSATKSVMSILVGIAVGRGEMPGPETKLVDALGWLDRARLRGDVGTIEIRHLLTHTSGLAHAMGLRTGRSAIEELLHVPLGSRPGEAFDYNNLNTDILSMILTDSTGLTAAEYAQRNLFGPLGLRRFTWTQRDGYSVGAGGLIMTTRDLAKVGYLLLEHGVWDGVRIVPEEWIEESLAKKVWSGETYRGTPVDYGYQWWLHQFSGHRAFTAYGFGGQFVSVIPDLDLVVAATGEREASAEREDIIPDVILPAVAAD